jgi:hypothetical protein
MRYALPTKVGTDFAEERQSRGQCSSLADLKSRISVIDFSMADYLVE